MSAAKALKFARNALNRLTTGTGVNADGLVGAAKAQVMPLSQVATRCAPPQINTPGNKEWVATSVRRMMASVTRFKIEVGYGHIASLREADPGGPAYFMASVEYPAGTHTRVLFKGNKLGMCPGLDYLLSDWIDVPIPAGAEFWVTIQGNAPTGGSVYNLLTAAQIPASDKMYTAVSFAGADYTMGAAYTGNVTGGAFWPSAVVAETDATSTILIGDSRVYSANDTVDSAYDLGEVARSVGELVGYINIARSGDYASFFNADHDWRLAPAKYCTMAIVEYGINDILNYGTSGFAQARLARYTDNILKMLPPGMPAYITTMGPVTNSTDGWVTTGNQTIPNATRETVRTVENDRRRTVPKGWSGCIDIADVIETARNSGIWKANYTNDGVHAIQAACLALKDADIIQPVVRAAKVSARRNPVPAPNQTRVELITAARTLLEGESKRTFSNEGAAAQVVFSLPEALPGLTYTFIVQDADGIRVNAFSSDTIRIAGSVSAAAGNIQSATIGSVVTLLAINQVEWFATVNIGTWTVT